MWDSVGHIYSSDAVFSRERFLQWSSSTMTSRLIHVLAVRWVRPKADRTTGQGDKLVRVTETTAHQCGTTRVAPARAGVVRPGSSGRGWLEIAGGLSWCPV